jgi:hypothetical protein
VGLVPGNGLDLAFQAGQRGVFRSRHGRLVAAGRKQPRELAGDVLRHRPARTRFEIRRREHAPYRGRKGNGIDHGRAVGAVRAVPQPGPTRLDVGRDCLTTAAQHLADVERQIDVPVRAYILAAERQELGNHLSGDRFAGNRLSRLGAARFERCERRQGGVDRREQLARPILEIRVVVAGRKHLPFRRDDPDSLILVLLPLDGEKQFAAAIAGLTDAFAVGLTTASQSTRSSAADEPEHQPTAIIIKLAARPGNGVFQHFVVMLSPSHGTGLNPSFDPYASSSLSTCPWTLVRRRWMPL